MAKLVKEIDNNLGYSIKKVFEKDEFDFVYSLIEHKWKDVLARSGLVTELDIFEKIIDYHRHIDDSIHQKLWSKRARMLTKDEVEKILSLNASGILKDFLGEFTITDEENINYPNMYWRIVRPWKEKDVGPVHRDEWFWLLNKSYKIPEHKRRIKVWIPLATEEGKSGLLVEKKSHKRLDIEWKGEKRHGIMKPTLITDEGQLNLSLAEAGLGDAIIFHDKLLHGGKLNTGIKTRVSLEFTVCISTK